jgi:hypothetical protein
MYKLCKSVVEWEAKSYNKMLLGNGIKASNEVERACKPINKSEVLPPMKRLKLFK